MSRADLHVTFFVPNQRPSIPDSGELYSLAFHFPILSNINVLSTLARAVSFPCLLSFPAIFQPVAIVNSQLLYSLRNSPENVYVFREFFIL